MNNFNDERTVDSLSSLCEAGACKKRRRYESVLQDTLVKAPVKSTVYKRAEIAADTIINALRYGEKNRKHIMEYMNSRYVEGGFINPQQKKQVLLGDWNRIMRYLNDEGRAPSFPKSGIITLHEDLNPIRVNPHVAFDCGDQVELVIFKIGKPNISQRGDVNKFKRDLQLYSMIKYGRALGYKNITASFYFLKKDTDKSIWGQNEPFFFGGGGNIVNMQDLVVGDEETQLDKDMNALIEEYIEGISEEDQTDDNCLYCQYRNICKYKSAPISIKNEDE